MFILKLQLIKLKLSKIWLWKQLGENICQNSGVWNVTKCKKICEFLETLSGPMCLQAGQRPSSLTLLPFVIYVLTPARNFWVGDSLLAFLFPVRRKGLDLKWIHSHYFKECMYLPMKTFIQIFILIFLKISVRLLALQPFRTSRPWLLILYFSIFWTLCRIFVMLSGNTLNDSV